MRNYNVTRIDITKPTGDDPPRFAGRPSCHRYHDRFAVVPATSAEDAIRQVSGLTGDALAQAMDSPVGASVGEVRWAAHLSEQWCVCGHGDTEHGDAPFFYPLPEGTGVARLVGAGECSACSCDIFVSDRCEVAAAREP